MTNPTRNSKPAGPTVPLAVWPIAQRSAAAVGQHRCHTEYVEHSGGIRPALTRRIIEEYSASGDLVVDPACGVGTTLIEAAVVGRRAIGLERDRCSVTTAKKNVRCALEGRRRNLANVRVGQPRTLTRRLGDVVGTVDLVCTSSALLKDCRRTSGASERSRKAVKEKQAADPEMAPEEIYAGCYNLLRPGGILAVVTRSSRRRGVLADGPGAAVALAKWAGFIYLQHVVAIDATICDGSLVAHPFSRQQVALRRSLGRGEPAHLITHHDVAVLRRPTSSESAHVN
jgi:SAM-dependent methyltransferase